MRPELHLLDKLSCLPDCDKVPVGRLARELNATQAVVLDMIMGLVVAGLVDRTTLRPKRLRPPQKPREDMVLVGEILPQIRQFLRDTGMLKSVFGKQCLNDPATVGAMESGSRRTIRRSTADRIHAFIEEYQGASGTARKASGTASSGAVSRPTGRAPSNEPAPRICPPASAHPPTPPPEPDFDAKFKAQLGRVERGEVGIAAVVRVPRRGDPSGTLGGVATGQL